MARNWRLIMLSDAERLWRGKPCYQQYGQAEKVTATGRARCRNCGERIEKGSPAIRFMYDFQGCGSWTAIQCHIHASPCELCRMEYVG